MIYLYNIFFNTKNGREKVLSNSNSINIIIQSLYNSNIKVKILVLELLSAICYLKENDGHSKVLKAIDHYREFANERSRFIIFKFLVYAFIFRFLFSIYVN